MDFCIFLLDAAGRGGLVIADHVGRPPGTPISPRKGSEDEGTKVSCLFHLQAPQEYKNPQEPDGIPVATYRSIRLT